MKYFIEAIYFFRGFIRVGCVCVFTKFSTKRCDNFGKSVNERLIDVWIFWGAFLKAKKLSDEVFIKIDALPDFNALSEAAWNLLSGESVVNRLETAACELAEVQLVDDVCRARRYR